MASANEKDLRAAYRAASALVAALPPTRIKLDLTRKLRAIDEKIDRHFDSRKGYYKK